MKQIFYQIIYHPHVNKALRNINKAMLLVLPHQFKLHPSGVVRVKNALGKVLKIKTNQTNYPTFLIFWNGYLNFEYTSIFTTLIKKVGVFYDVGANIGYYSLLAEAENNQIKVVGFEPATGPLFYFRENVRINNYQRIRVEPLALSHQQGEITFYEVKNMKYKYLKHNLVGEGNAGSKTIQRNFVTTKVKTTTLDQYIAEVGEDSIDLIKLDTEGTEHLILNHATSVLTQMKPIVICETLFNTIEAELERIFRKHHYEFYNHSGSGLVKIKSIVRQEDNGVRNCFFVHPSRYSLIEEFVQQTL
jgi:FkbM family methyltransferase